MDWTCPTCQHHGPLQAFYIKVLTDTDAERWDYVCPTCKHFLPDGTEEPKRPGTIPRITLQSKKTGEKIYFYTPTPKQVEAHLAKQRNVMYGGRAGTGKSIWLRNEAYMRCMNRPNYRVLLLRRNITELRDTHLDKAEAEAPQLGARWIAQGATGQYTVVFPNGSRLRFGHCETDASVKMYLSSEYDCIMIDEGATFTEYAARWIKSRLRTTKKGVIPIIRIGSNPGAMWLYHYYIKKDVKLDDDPTYRPEDYLFINATVNDNVHVNLEEQEMALSQLPSEALRRMYRDGDWLAVEGQFFVEWTPRNRETGRQWHVLKELPYLDGVRIDRIPWIQYIRVVDWGYDPDPGVCTWFALLPNNRFVAMKEYTFKKTIAAKVADAIVEQSVLPDGRDTKMKITQTIGGHDFWMTDGQTGESMADTFAAHKISMYQANTDRVNGWQRVHHLLKEVTHDGGGPVPMFQVYEDGCPMLAQTFPMMQGDPKRAGDIVEKDDHWVDTARWFAMSRPTSSKKPSTSIWSRFSPEIRRALLGQGERDVIGSESVRRG